MMLHKSDRNEGNKYRLELDQRVEQNEVKQAEWLKIKPEIKLFLLQSIFVFYVSD